METNLNTPGPQIPKSPVNKTAIAIVALGALIVCLTIVIIYLLQNKTAPNEKNIPKKTTEIPTNSTSTQATNSQATTTESEINDSQNPTPKEQYITVNWNKEWQKAGVQKMENNAEYPIYSVGKVLGGTYSGSPVFVRAEEEMGTYYVFYLEKDGKQLEFTNQNIKVHGIDDLPQKINLSNTGYTLTKNNFGSTKFADIVTQFKIFTDSNYGDIYLTKEGCLAAELPNHLTVTFDLNLPFVNKESRELSATFNDGTKNQDSYTYNRIIGCGALCYYLAVMDEGTLKPQERLIEVGTTSNGESLYGIKDSNDKALKDLYSDKNTMAYYDTSKGYDQTEQSKYTYSEFLKYRPLLYWKDPLGRWIEFKNDRFQTAAEMCKPVIYLYPVEKTDLTIQVKPNGGITFSKPNYLNGWEVTAGPNGLILDKRSNAEYPYLFWEGIGLNYPTQNSGFVIQPNDLKNFLDEKLALLGLNQKEIADFKNYWVNRLQGLGKPYLKISFLSKDQFNELAPLNISPLKPQSVIRVMMTAKGIETFENIPEQELPAPSKRDGFTVVEWGGAVLK